MSGYYPLRIFYAAYLWCGKNSSAAVIGFASPLRSRLLNWGPQKCSIAMNHVAKKFWENVFYAGGCQKSHAYIARKLQASWGKGGKQQ